MSRMKNSLLALLCCFGLSHVSGCFSSPEDVHVIIQPVVEELSVTFQLLDITSDGRSDEVASRGKRKRYTPLAEMNNLRDDTCISIRQGLSQLMYGYNEYYVMLDSTDVQSTYSRVFDFSCAADSYFRNADIPLEIKTYSYASDMSLKTHHIELYNEEDARDKELQGELIIPVVNGHHIRLINNHIWGSGKLMVTYLYSSRYTVKLSDSIVPGIDFLSHLGKLQTPFQSHEAEWHRFLQEYGTHYFTEAELGGIIHVQTLTNCTSEGVVASRSVVSRTTEQYTLDEVLDTIWKEGDNSTIIKKAVSVLGGTLKANSPLVFWMQTIPMYPAIIKGTKKSILSLMEELQFDNETVGAFRLVTEAEKQHHQLKKLYGILQCGESTTPLRRYLCQLVGRELDFITPNPSVLRIINQIVDGGNKIDGSYILFSATEGDDTTWFKIPIQKGVCSTLTRQLTWSENSTWVLPAGYNCVNGYKDADCFNQLISTNNPSQLVSLAHKLRSFKLCKRW